MKSNKLKVIDGVNEELYCPHCNKLLLEKIDFDNENPINHLNLKCEHTKYIAMTEPGVIFMSNDFNDSKSLTIFDIIFFSAANSYKALAYLPDNPDDPLILIFPYI